MNNPPEFGADFAHRAVLDAATRLRREGWTVEVEPSETLPELGKFRPDYIAKRGDETVIGEVKYFSQDSLQQLKILTGLVAKIPNARLDVDWLGSIEPMHEADEVEILTARARNLVAIDTGAALLLAWSAFSGAMASTSLLQEFENNRPMSVRQRLARMSSIGAISDTQFMRLDEASTLRNDIAHGSTELPEAETVEYVCVTAEAIARNAYYSIEAMREWFLEHYEDPAEIIPFESREGGSFYYAGGPHQADDVLRENFEFMPQIDIEEALSTLNDVSFEWIKKADYYDES